MHDISDADAILFATCVVIESTERKIMKRLRELSSLGVPMAVTGCAGSVIPENLRGAVPHAIIFAPGDTDGPVKYLVGAAGRAGIAAANESCPNPRIQSGAASRAPPKKPRLACVAEIPFTGNGEVVAPIPIASGCTGSCSYCITKIARGGLKSKPVKSVLAEASDALERGAVELQLCAQDAGVYGKDIGSSLSELVEAVCSLEGDFMVRVGMANPGSVKDSFYDLLDAFDNPKVFKFLHLPVQSGDDDILASMNRRHTADEATGMMKSFRKRFPESTISTDVIVGYPGEVPKSHEATKRFLELTRPDSINVTRYSHRPGTAAAGLDGAPGGRTVKARSRELTAMRKRIATENNMQWLGKTLEVLATELGKGPSTRARSAGYKHAIIARRVGLGKRYVVRIERANGINLFGKIE
jgi:threonylcarbamoyladenosine tRNA methylthiotransferase CDKAL1